MITMIIIKMIIIMIMIIIMMSMLVISPLQVQLSVGAGLPVTTPCNMQIYYHIRLEV